MVPNPDEIVHARMTTWGQGLIELPAGRGVPEDIWEQMSLLFGEPLKGDLLRQVVVAEMRKLETAGKADLNQMTWATVARPRRSLRPRGRPKGGRPFGGRPFSKKFKSKGGYKSKTIQVPRWSTFLERQQARQADGRWQGQEESEEKAGV